MEIEITGSDLMAKKQLLFSCADAAVVEA